jgi:HAD superfamily hydrolase (TIGR01509 family)
VVTRAVVFDLDGVLVDSEDVWDAARREVTACHGGSWRAEATADMQGMSSLEWSRYLVDRLGVRLSAERANAAVVERVLDRYERGLPLLPGALEAVRRLGRRWRLALATSSNRPVIDAVVALAGLDGSFATTISSEEVGRGKPAPDVYLEAARRLGDPPDRCVAVEDSANGIRSAVAAGLLVVAVPRPGARPPNDVLARAGAVLGTLDDLNEGVIDQMATERARHADELVDEAEIESFPASDPHSGWAGPPD